MLTTEPCGGCTVRTGPAKRSKGKSSKLQPVQSGTNTNTTNTNMYFQTLLYLLLALFISRAPLVLFIL